MAPIPVSGPWITDKEVEYVADAARNGWYANANTWNRRFEDAFSAYLGVKHSVTLPSCTSAIHLALAALGVGPGDEVIVPDATWIATAAPITYVGATPVFADIEAETWCLDPASVAHCLTERTAAVITVDLYGNVPDMDGLRDVVGEHDIPLVEDAAEAIGAAYLGRPAGALGDVGVFSFHGSKTLTTGEGGMLTTNDTRLFDRVQILRDHGRLPGDTNFFNQEVGFKYKMSSMQAALGVAQLERVDELIARKREIFEWYRQELAEVEGVTLNYERPGTSSTYWMVTAVIARDLNVSKGELLQYLSDRGIDGRPFFHPLSSLPAFRDTGQAQAAQARNAVSYDIGCRSVNLPSGLNLKEPDVHYVCEVLRTAVKRAAARSHLAEVGVSA